MKQLIIKPDGWKCKLEECPPGFFVVGEDLFFKSEYGKCEVFCGSGETFWGGVKTSADRDKLLVQPVTYEWVKEER